MQGSLARPLHVAIAGVVWLLLAGAIWGTRAEAPWEPQVAGHVLSFDDDPIPNEAFVVIHDWQAWHEGWVRTKVLELRTDAQGRYTLDLPGKGRHVLTLLHNGQSARTEIHVMRSGVGIARADLPLRNAARHGREPHDLEHLMHRAGKNREFIDRAKELRGARAGISVRAWYGLANR